MVSPSSPEQEGNPKVQHDDMPQEGHDAQVGHAGGQKSEGGSGGHAAPEPKPHGHDEEDEE